MRQVAMSRRAVALFAAAVVVATAWVLAPRPALGAAAAATDDVVVALPGCSSHCGNISIPHPFGVEPGCYHPGFNVTCRSRSSNSSSPPELFLGDGTVQVLEISIANATVRVNASFAYFPGNDSSTNIQGAKPIASGTWSGALGVGGGVYAASSERNRMLVIGCNVQVFLVDAGDADRRRRTLSTCAAFCDWDDWSSFNPAAGPIYCEAAIMRGRSSYEFKTLKLSNAATGSGPNMSTAVWACILDSDVIIGSFDDDVYRPWTTSLPAVLDWRINHTTCYGNASSAVCRSNHSFCQNKTDGRHICSCAEGYQAGNPYIPNGCKDVNECRAPETYPCYGICNNTEGSYLCRCPPGFVGNASQPNGCKDIDECAHPDRYPCYGDCTNMRGSFQCRCKHGTYGDPFTKGSCISSSGLKISLGVGGGAICLLLVLGVPFITRKIKKHKVKRMKEIFFKQNHGLLLQKLVSHNSDIGGRMIITLCELEKATNNFDPSHEVGGGGHGVVYKGLLDLQVVAIKKSKIIVQREIDDFINEVAILSQINHRNIVKLLGCCLETEVPLLVYEFISNGTLADHLHVEGNNISLPWDDRMRIALEISKALAYLHSAASTPVLHRDIKSSNILLDDNLTAKISDFGASRYVPIDQTGVTTAVQGTIGYLDPMYYYTSRLTDKSDVFSFGVLLIELLTRKKPFIYRSKDGEGLVTHFSSIVAHGDLTEILDPQIMEEEGELVDEVAILATKCTKLNGEDRPTMREVEMTLENFRGTKKHVRHNTTLRRKYEKDRTAIQNKSFEGLALETSRQYSMEEEIMLSARYPR